VGTTSLRTLETLYWLGIQTLTDPGISSLHLEQWDVYEKEWPGAISRKEALEALLHWMDTRSIQNIFTQTQLLIVPGYIFRVVDILITNFHQPQSTLLLIVAAALGDAWKKMYDYALTHDFRFLSYGDASLLFIRKDQG
jgi:S-adenosylmethionine:tRNA ribosyltransferase-isomerase